MEQIGPYQILGELGRGGMGIVYRGLDPVIGRTVAVKTVHSSDLGDSVEQEKLKERLFREAKSAGILSHPGIVTIYQAGQDKDVLFIAMEFIDGPNLADALARTKPSVELTLQILKQAAEALDYAHTKGVIHRDIKPANLLLQSEGRIKVADFGIAKLAATNLTKTGTTVGSPAYMSPEQIRAMPMDGRADQYSLAIVAYEMLTGLRPYDSDTITSLVFKVVFEQPDLSLLQNVPGGSKMEPVFLKALAKTAPERYDNCMAFWAALAEAAGAGERSQLESTLPFSSVNTQQATTGVNAPLPKSAEPAAAPAAPPPSRRGLIAGIAAAVVIVGGGGVYWAMSSKTPSPEPKKEDPKPEPPKQPTGEERATAPELLQRVNPDYTPEALKAGIQGAVKLRIGINEQGKVEEADVVKSLDPGLDLKAIEAVKKWSFKPAMLKGKPVAVRSQVELEFLIQK
jgi:serine/threonine-protein kinase